MYFGVRTIVAALALSALPALAQAQTIDAGQLLVELNTARTDPHAYSGGLQLYRGYFHANLLRYPGLDADIETEEGVKVVDETIAYLRHQAPLGQIQPSRLLQAAAAEHLADQQRTGAVGHAGSDGASPGARVQRLGGGAYVAEVISYGSIDAAS
jgi:uncharacterized protein YkwD